MKQRRTSVKGAIFSHTLVNSAGTLLTVAAHALLLTWLIRDLGLAGYGVYALMTAMALQFNLFDDSLGAWITREAARVSHRAVLRPRLSGALALYAGLSVPVLAAIAALTCFGLRGAGAATLALALAVGATGFGLEGVSTFARKMLEGRERFGLVKSIQVSTLLARLGGVAGVRFLAPDVDPLPAYAVVFAASMALQALASTAAVRAVFGWLPRPSARAARPVWRRAARFGAPVFGVKCTAILSNRLDLWLVAALLTPVDVGLYGVATRFHGLVLQAIEISRSFILPLSVRLRRELSRERFRDFFLRATSLSALLTFGAVTVVALNARAVIEAWLGSASLGAVPPLLLLLAFAATVAFRAVGQTVLLAEGRFALLLAPFVVASLVNFAVSVAATAVLGVVGPALGTLVGGVVLLAWNLARILRELQVTPDAYLSAAAPAVAAWLVAAGTGYAIGLGIHGAPGLLAGTAVYVVTHAALFFAFLLNRADRVFLLGLLRGRGGSLAA